MNKKFIFLSVFLVFILLGLSVVVALSDDFVVQIKQTAPVNASYTTSNTDIYFNVTLNETLNASGNCLINITSPDGLTNYTGYQSMLARNNSIAGGTSIENTTWSYFYNRSVNNSVYTLIAEGNVSVGYKCLGNDSSPSYNQTYFTVDRTAPTVVITNPTDRINLSKLNVTHALFYINGTCSDDVSLAAPAVVYTNSTGDIFTHDNSPNTFALSNSTGNITEGLRTIKVSCNDTAGNIGNDTVEYNFDRTIPIANISGAEFNPTNKTSAWNMSINFSMIMTDAPLNGSQAYRCRIEAIAGDGDTAFTDYGDWSNESLSMYRVNLDAGIDIIYDNFIVFRPECEDYAGNLGSQTAANNQTNWTLSRLKTGWNMITSTNNNTLGGIANLSDTVTIVSVWSNQYKNYTTHVSGTDTNQDTGVWSSQPIFVYATTNTTLFRRYEGGLADNSSIDVNTTLYGGWNHLAVFNNTITFDEIEDLDGQNTGPTGEWTQTNTSISIRYVSYWNATSQEYVTYRSGFTFGFTNNTEVTSAMSFWVNVNATNITQQGILNRRVLR